MYSIQWKNLVCISMKWHVLCVMIQVDCTLLHVMSKLERFEKSIEEKLTQIQIPTSSILLNVADFSGIKTIAFLVHNLKTGETICPEPRADPTKQIHSEVGQTYILH